MEKAYKFGKSSYKSQMNDNNHFLALSGGGDRGVVMLGILIEMFEQKGEKAVGWTEIAGISAGAFCGGYISQTTPQTFRAEAQKLKDYFVSGQFDVVEPWVWGGQVINFIAAFASHNSMFTNGKMVHMIDKWFDEKRMIRRFKVGTFNKTKSRYETFDSLDKTHDMKKAMLASASVPVFLPEVSIDEFNYQDGCMRHIIPVPEIDDWITRTSGKRQLDIVVCFPVNRSDIFLKMVTPVTFNPLINEATRVMADLMLEQLQNDLKYIARICDVPLCEITKKSCGKFVSGDLTVQILSPAEGKFTSFLDMNGEKNEKMFETGSTIVKNFLGNLQLKY